MTGSYSMQNIVATPTNGPHISSWTLKIKPCIKARVHPTKFYQNCLKFVGADTVWLAATLCKAV